jgi:uncharacterized protein (DUF433 family)
MNLKPPLGRITIEPGKMGGQPCIRGMRITVRRVLEILATYPERAQLFQDYPDLEEEDLQQALGFASGVVHGWIDPHLDPA